MGQYLEECIILDLDIELIKTKLVKFNISILLCYLFFNYSLNIDAQTKSDLIFVDGVCGMCEKRIETKCINAKGIKMADWNVENRILKIVYNEKKISLKEIHKHIASFGHDTKLEKAPDQAYNSLEMCCKYRDEEVVKNHQ